MGIHSATNHLSSFNIHQLHAHRQHPANMAKFFALLMLALAFFVGCAVAAPQFGFGGRPGGFGGRPGGFGNNFGGGFRPGQFFQPSTAGGFGNGQAGGGTAIGTGTGIANTDPTGSESVSVSEAPSTLRS